MRKKERDRDMTSALRFFLEYYSFKQIKNEPFLSLSLSFDENFNFLISYVNQVKRD